MTKRTADVVDRMFVADLAVDSNVLLSERLGKHLADLVMKMMNRLNKLSLMRT